MERFKGTNHSLDPGIQALTSGSIENHLTLATFSQLKKAISPSLGARQAPRNLRGQNIENEKIPDICRPGPADSDEGP